VNESHRTKFLVELIKPSHYDDDGYLIQWWRGFRPVEFSVEPLTASRSTRSRGRLLGESVDLDIEAPRRDQLEGAGG